MDKSVQKIYIYTYTYRTHTCSEWLTVWFLLTQCNILHLQVSALAWNKDHHQLISAHGCPKNYMVVWQYPTLKKLRQLSGHSDRILHMCMSPRRGRVASAGSDETLRIWPCFERLQHDMSQSSYREENILALLHSFN